MAVRIDVEYLGDLHTRATHGPSGDTFITDAPVDNGGRGEAFSPTDLVATAVGTCVLTILGTLAQRLGIDLSGAKAHVEKHMATAPLRRIGRLDVNVVVPAERAVAIDQAQRDKLERAAMHCPVHQSLHPDIAQNITFTYEAPAPG